MQSERIDVICHAGHRGEERPVTFALRGLRIDVVRVLDQWVEEGKEDRVRRRFFKVRGSDGGTHRLCFDESDQEWYYGTR